VAGGWSMTIFKASVGLKDMAHVAAMITYSQKAPRKQHISPSEGREKENLDIDHKGGGIKT